LFTGGQQTKSLVLHFTKGPHLEFWEISPVLHLQKEHTFGFGEITTIINLQEETNFFLTKARKN
jgi:hypothetical protein